MQVLLLSVEAQLVILSDAACCINVHINEGKQISCLWAGVATLFSINITIKLKHPDAKAPGRQQPIQELDFFFIKYRGHVL